MRVKVLRSFSRLLSLRSGIISRYGFPRGLERRSTTSVSDQRCFMSTSIRTRNTLNMSKLATACVAGAIGIAICPSLSTEVECNAPVPPYNKEFGPNFIADAVEVAVPALVNITSRLTDPFGREAQTAGSGFIIDSTGLVATNAHVVLQSKNIKLTLYDGRVLQGRVHSYDLATDLALIEITDPITDPLPVMEIGCSANLRPGEFVIALGSPLNMSNSVTAGIVSSVARQASELGVTQKRTDYIQTDAAINQGNSGGPLINLKGQVIGINTMKVAGTGGIGFAIPIDTAWIVLSQLRKNRKVVRPYLGLKMFRLTPEIIARERHYARHFPEVQNGVMVVKVNPNSPAEKGGLKAGDVIVEMDGIEIKTINDITNKMGYEIGQTHEFTVIRKGNKRATLRVKTSPISL